MSYPFLDVVNLTLTTHLPEKAFSVCIKDGIFIDQTCGSGGFFYKGYNFVELYNPSADVLLFVRASNAEIYAMRLSYVAL